MARVALENVSKLYPGGVKAVDSVDLSIADQEFVVLVGPSGCGKSTTLRMIAGLEEITGGQIRIGDRIVNDIPPKNRDIAMVFQNYALYPHMTVYKNMAFALKLRGVPKPQIHQRVIEAAKTLDIEHLLERKPKALSGGQRQRVAVGRAIVREPAAFLFDEPLSNLDAKLRVTTRAELKRLHHRLKTTTIYVTHDQEEAMTLGDRIVVMKEGKIQQADTPLRTYNHPVNRFVAGFIGMPPMNFFDGQIREIGGEMAFAEGKAVYPKLAGGGAGSNGNGNGHGSHVKIGELTMPGGGFTLAVPSCLRDTMRKSLNRHVVLGIRPEHFHLRPIDGQTDINAAVKMHLNVIEPLGNDMDVYMHTALHDHVVGRVEAQAGLQRDSEQTIYVDLQKIHFFEPGETGMNLSLKSEPAHALA
ncbi:MAG TPA: sn-glycerol-3-phosphate ABC transporter ATP-binding protein UgpC [Tepidisphaeraceae bacterium]|jgi:multiple sugar transport system ATP-binding protein|nr:sn-glycerol-3-phosphate ABC transporter ATP-binding protein UgpC [Tepidisphaeraceae bacterium]